MLDAGGNVVRAAVGLGVGQVEVLRCGGRVIGEHPKFGSQWRVA